MSTPYEGFNPPEAPAEVDCPECRSLPVQAAIHDAITEVMHRFGVNWTIVDDTLATNTGLLLLELLSSDVRAEVMSRGGGLCTACENLMWTRYKEDDRD